VRVKTGTLVGLALIVLGLLLLTKAVTFSMLVVDTSPPKWKCAQFFYGSIDNPVPPYVTTLSEDQSAPSILEPARSGTIAVIVNEDNPASTATISINGVKQTMQLYLVSETSSGSVATYALPWTVPSTLGDLIRFDVEVSDQAGNKVTKTLYATTAAVEGYFTINGQRVTPQDVLYLNTKKLQIAFVATSGASSIQAVRLYVKNLGSGQVIYDGTMDGSAPSWSKSIELPSDGKYDVSGYIVVYGKPYCKMSITIDTGTPLLASFSYSQAAGVIFMLAGIAMIVRRG